MFFQRFIKSEVEAVLVFSKSNLVQKEYVFPFLKPVGVFPLGNS